MSTWEEARRKGHVDDLPEGLVRAFRKGTCIAMVGAGLSVPAGLPGFEALLKAVAEAEKIELALPDHGSYDDLDKVQFYLAARIGKERMCEMVKCKLFVRGPLPDAMQVVLTAFTRLPFAAVVSWNWDNILDAKYAYIPNTITGFEMLTLALAKPESYDCSQSPLLKMQGDLNNASTVVLTEADYAKREPGARAFLKTLHEARTVLYVGMSLRAGGVGDERRAGSTHFAILNDVTPQRRQELLHEFNIQAISYDSKATNWGGSRMIMEELALRVYGSCVESACPPQKKLKRGVDDPSND
eukprot:TRINITY_DN113974_c0_g1_i1.p1 TRINITY_DN113974_c0_g1~~TRINITY_DN113974_c0_g1_i1.p1  ORF type:complete len:311 (+),score=19.35 TRINITY_DN113974_c0_g1_i1:37-933(+)